MRKLLATLCVSSLVVFAGDTPSTSPADKAGSDKSDSTDKKAEKAAKEKEKAEEKAKEKEAREKEKEKGKERASKLPQKKDPDEIGNRDVAKGVNFYSIEKEIAIGKGLAQQVEHEAKVIDDPIIAEYVNRVGQNLVRNSDAKVPFTIKVLDTEEVNAFALPGGFFFVNSGLILKADSEAELAGVMAHEIAHVAARHGTRQATRGEIAQLATIPLLLMGGWTGYGVRQAANVAIPIGFLTFSRGFESEADLLGLEYMYKTGYDPGAFVDFFEKIQSLEKKKPGSLSKVFSTHPLTADRIETAQKNIQEYLKERPEYVVTTSEFVDVKARLAALHNRRKIDNKDSSRPTLRKAPGSGSGDGKDGGSSDDDRPTLKRRPDSQ